jgi:hypothetical protein
VDDERGLPQSPRGHHLRLEPRRRDQEAGDSQRLRGGAGAGRLHPRPGHSQYPAIHSPRNATGAGTTSFHIYNCDDGPVLHEQVGPIEGLASYEKSVDPPARPPELFLRVRQDVLRAHIEAALRFPGPRTMGTLEAIHGAGDAETRDAAERSMRAIDPVKV